MTTLHFHSPEALWLLLLLPCLAAFWIWRAKKRPRTIQFPGTAWAKLARPGWTTRLRFVPPVLRLLALALFIVALARPQGASEVERVSTNGVDILLALDVSGSMQALDMLSGVQIAKLRAQNAEQVYKSRSYEPYTRLGFAKAVLAQFVEKRPHDRMGLVEFGASARTVSPLTLDGAMLQSYLERIDGRDSAMGSRTAIGDGLMNALVRLRGSQAKSRVVVLLTDGRDNASVYPPLYAAQLAKSLGVKVYTVGVGKKSGNALAFSSGFFGGISWDMQSVEGEDAVDEASLQQIASLTGGAYFRAENQAELEKIYGTIDQLEKSEIDTHRSVKYSEEFYPWLLAGFAALLLGLAFRRFTPNP
jgi:Ca-activated chloride channel family protein